MKAFCKVPPAPHILGYLVNDYHTRWKKLGLTFYQFLQISGYAHPAHNLLGMDDHTHGVVEDEDAMQLTIPHRVVRGEIRIMVLLVDFPDLEGRLPREHYHDLLFARQTSLTGSMADYYDEVSRGQVHIRGEIHGWLRMPHNYTYYTNGHSGLTDPQHREHYPRDARKLVEDAVDVALTNEVPFTPDLDLFDDHTITALCIVHAGQGAEKLHPLLRGDHLWSHTWTLKHPKWVATDLWATTYLIVPQDALLGVCAHELGHLVFQWQTFYDPNYSDDGEHWDGNGIWDLMAGGAYAGDELRPVHPAGLHKLQHGWIEVEEVRTSQHNVVLKPVTQKNGKLMKIHSPHYHDHQYLLLEYRARQSFDRALPGEGLLVWRIDELAHQERGQLPSMLLIQADGRHHLRDPDDRHNGDPGDPFPGSKQVATLTDTGIISTSFPNSCASGITLLNIQHHASTKEVRLDIDITTS
jgi:immune inhibitor A